MILMQRLNMILMPVWIVSEDENNYVALLGSQPKADAKKEVLPKDCVKNILYSPEEHDSGYKFALVILDQEKIPEDIKHLVK